MNGWMTLWTCVLMAALVLFTCLTVVVTIGGLLDIRRMLRQVVHQHEEPDRAADDRNS